MRALGLAMVFTGVCLLFASIIRDWGYIKQVAGSVDRQFVYICLITLGIVITWILVFA